MTEEELAARRAKPLGVATTDELASELWMREEVDDDWLCARFGLEPEEEYPFAHHASDFGDIYDAIAEGRTIDALTALHALVGADVSLLAPASQLRLRGRKAA